MTYEVTVKELGYRPEPYCIADALMYADGKPIVEITDMSLRLTRADARASWKQIWASEPHAVPRPTTAAPLRLLYDRDRSSPSPSASRRRRSASRTASSTTSASSPACPGRRTSSSTASPQVDGEPWVLKAGGACEAEYDVPPTPGTSTPNRSERMPFAVLLEIALAAVRLAGGLLRLGPDQPGRPDVPQPRRQGRPAPPGHARQRHARPRSVKMTKRVEVRRHDHPALRHSTCATGAGRSTRGTTYFGFFTKEALANQVGIRDAKVPWPTDAERAGAERGVRCPHDAAVPRARCCG